ncbi:MAG: VOC family protein [Clostridiaceae bacterium]|nr:VOC family protein [Clostridiaceae bacterium]
MSYTFAHYNFNVTDLSRSLNFYSEAVGLSEMRRNEAADGRFIIVYLGDDQTDFRLELTWLRDWEKDSYDLGDNEMHLAFVTDDFEKAHAKHAEMGCICYENPTMGIYFIEDPDGYWIEILPKRK